MGICGKWLFEIMGIWDSKCIWDVIWPQDTTAFLDIYRKKDGD